ncbi:PseG/SpsG family protein [Dermacoccaceae bacterium W4C1]
MGSADPLAVGIRADADTGIGVGHAIRCLALAQELVHRGAHVELWGRLEIDWVAQAYAQAGVVVHRDPQVLDDPTLLAATWHQRGLRQAVLDGYHLDPGTGTALREAGLRVLAMVDDHFGAEQQADLYVDQNLGARPRPVTAPAVALAGIEYAMFRDSLLQHRRPEALTVTAPDPANPPRLQVLAVFGGTDPFGAAPVLAPAVLATGVGMDLRVICPDAQVRARVAALPVGADQRVHALAAVTDLPALAAQMDVVITASGSSVWELLCLGVPTGVVCVVDNQELGYRATTEAGLVAGLGMLDRLRVDGPTALEQAALADLLTDPDRRRQLADAGRARVDGQGRERVADALEAAARR